VSGVPWRPRVDWNASTPGGWSLLEEAPQTDVDGGVDQEGAAGGALDEPVDDRLQQKGDGVQGMATPVPRPGRRRFGFSPSGAGAPPLA
jgi:hypothetical protein